MTYLAFLLVFIVPPILLLAVLQKKPLAGIPGKRSMVALPLTCLIALVYTTPWDNYLVYRGVWMYGDDRVLGTIGYVPIEEYLFFLLQPFLGGLLMYRLLAVKTDPIGEQRPWANVLGAVPFIAAGAWGAWLLLNGTPNGVYMGLILAWAGPVLAVMWLYAGSLFWDQRRTYAISVAVPTLYLWVADRLAIGMDIWHISDELSFAFDPLGLPIEEAVFFLITNILVVQGTMLFLFGDRIRWRIAQPSAG